MCLYSAFAAFAFACQEILDVRGRRPISTGLVRGTIGAQDFSHDEVAVRAPSEGLRLGRAAMRWDSSIGMFITGILGV